MIAEATKRVVSATTGGISQDDIIFGVLLLAFFMFITMKGELPTYMGFFAPGKSATTSSAASAYAPASGSIASAVDAASSPFGVLGPGVVTTLNGIVANLKSDLTGGGKVAR